MSNFSRFPFLIVLMALVFAASGVSAQLCPSAEQCRSGGQLLHKPNSKGHLVWTTPCGPLTVPPVEDPICSAIASCSKAGGFGKFLQAVTFECKSKHFTGYFGLDGMTFGILDWTSSNLPGIMKAYQNRSPDGYQRDFGKLALPLRNGCLDTNWVCNANRQAKLMCNPDFRSSFMAAIATADFKKAEIDFAVLQYEARLKRYESLGLKTEYGNTAMAVLANNLRNTAACKPSRWKAMCQDKANEKAMVDCMLDQYVSNACRGGSKKTSEDRAAVIKRVFADNSASTNVHPTSAEVEQCVGDWAR